MSKIVVYVSIYCVVSYFLAKTISCVCLENNIFSCGAHFISTQYVVLYSFHKYNMLWYVLGLVLSCGVCVWSCGMWFVVLVLCFLWSVGVVWCCGVLSCGLINDLHIIH